MSEGVHLSTIRSVLSTDDHRSSGTHRSAGRSGGVQHEATFLGIRAIAVHIGGPRCCCGDDFRDNFVDRLLLQALTKDFLCLLLELLR